MKKLSKIIGSIVAVVLILLLVFVLFLSINEYKPKEVEQLTPISGHKKISQDDLMSLLSFNIGYAGLSDSEDFFMDGGKKIEPATKQLVEENLEGITDVLQDNPADVYLLQEVDHNSKRSKYINQEDYLTEKLGMDSVFAYNFNVPYVPFPLPPIGRVESGIMTMTDFEMTSASRIALPNPFKWPISMANLKRALLETRYEVEGTDKELVIYNLHLEAYDNGDGKVEQSKLLKKYLEQEYKKGNYVIAGGDFNQVFEGSHVFPDTKQEGWHPGNLEKTDIPAHFTFAFDDEYPTVRVLNHEYTGDYNTSQVYVIDGFIVSDNVNVKEVSVLNQNFRYSDHHPVKMEVELGK